MRTTYSFPVFGNIGWGEMVVIVIAGLVILGPERLPGAMSWLARTIKQVRGYATGAQTQLREELGPEFDDLRKPLSELQQLRGMTPRAAITKHLLDGDDSLFTGEFGTNPQQGGASSGGSGSGPAQSGAAQSGAAQSGSGRPAAGNQGSAPGPAAAPAPPQDAQGPARAVYDEDAT